MKASNKETATFTGEGLSNKLFLGFPICCDTFGFTLWLFRRLSRPWWFNLHLFNLDLLAFLVGLGTLAHDHFLSWTLSPRLFGIASRVERTVKGAHFEKKHKWFCDLYVLRRWDSVVGGTFFRFAVAASARFDAANWIFANGVTTSRAGIRFVLEGGVSYTSSTYQGVYILIEKDPNNTIFKKKNCHLRSSKNKLLNKYPYLIFFELYDCMYLSSDYTSFPPLPQHHSFAQPSIPRMHGHLEVQAQRLHQHNWGPGKMKKTWQNMGGRSNSRYGNTWQKINRRKTTVGYDGYINFIIR